MEIQRSQQTSIDDKVTVKSVAMSALKFGLIGMALGTGYKLLQPVAKKTYDASVQKYHSLSPEGQRNVNEAIDVIETVLGVGIAAHGVSKAINDYDKTQYTQWSEKE